MTPPADGRPADAELGGDLRAGQHAGGEQAFLFAYLVRFLAVSLQTVGRNVT